MAAASTGKVFVAQVLRALRSPARATPTIDGLDCPRLWVQGVVTAVDDGGCELDDGTGLLRVELRAFLRNAPPDVPGARPAVGDYVMAIGPLHKGGEPRMVAHQVVVLNAKPQREAVWFLEVIEYWSAVVAR